MDQRLVGSLEDGITIKSFNGIGDLLFVTPTLRVIKEAYPNVKITVNTNYPELVDTNPFVDHVNTGKDGVFLGYPDPIHIIWPIEHHIRSDWKVVCNAYGLETEPPAKKPELYLEVPGQNGDYIGVQVLHKGHWHKKKLWPKFNDLANRPGFMMIPYFGHVLQLIEFIATCKAVVCAEGGISHIAKALGIPAIVIYGGFARPEWNGYRDQINICNEKWCSYCYDPTPCKNEVERICMKEITVEQVLRAVEGLSKIDELSHHCGMGPIAADAGDWCKGKGVDIGGGNWPLPGARPIEDCMEENAYLIREHSKSLDFVFSSHCLEHLNRPERALKEWIRVIKPGGILYLYLPHPDYIPWRKESMPKWHKHNLHLQDVLAWLEGIEVIEIVQKDHYFGQKIIGRKV